MIKLDLVGCRKCGEGGAWKIYSNGIKLIKAECVECGHQVHLDPQSVIITNKPDQTGFARSINNFDNGRAIRRYDLGHAWECNVCHNVLTRRCDVEDCCKDLKDFAAASKNKLKGGKSDNVN